MSPRDPRSARLSTQPMDPLWLIAFPIYFGFMLCYGAFATVYYLPQLRVGAQNDPQYAQLFGLLIAVASLLGLVGSLITIFSDDTRLESLGHAAVIALMGVYFVVLTYLIGVVHDPATRPGSSFVPLVFSVFPMIRLAVIRRKR